MASEDDDDFNNTNEDQGQRLVGRGLTGRETNPEDPQWFLANSDHPYAPFPTNALKWESFVYSDGTTYEGLTQVNVPHNKGVMVFGSGTGAGLQSVNPYDKYEGEFFYGFANGLGAFTSNTTGEVYRGEWSYGKRSGCGASINMGAYLNQIRQGAGSVEAWEKAKENILSDKMRYGYWDGDILMEDTAKTRDPQCSVAEIRGILQEMESVVTRARMFKHKPDGDVTHMTLRDKRGTPVPVFQDPVHYPHGTKFLAPGPIGQCHPVPDSPVLKSEMRKHARNYMRIYNQYNLPYFAKPGDDMFAAARLNTLQIMGREFYNRVMAGQEPEDAQKDLEDWYIRNKKYETAAEATQPQKQAQRANAAPQSSPTPKPDTRKAASSPKTRPREVEPEEEEEDIDEDELIASTSYLDDSEAGREGPEGRPPSVFCHIGGRSQNLTRFVCITASRTYKRVLPRLMRRRPLGEG